MVFGLRLLVPFTADFYARRNSVLRARALVLRSMAGRNSIRLREAGEEGRRSAAIGL